MKYVADSFEWQNKDWLDQPLHFGAGAGLTLLPTLLLNTPLMVILSALIVLACGAYREWKQHPSSKVIFNLDYIFVVLGVVVSAVLSLSV